MDPGAPPERRARGGAQGRRARAAPERLYGLHPIREALRARRRRLIRLLVRRGPRRPELARLVEEAAGAGLRVEELDAREFQAAAPPGVNPQGVLLEAGPLPEVRLEEVIGSGHPSLTLVALDGVEDPQNVGAVVRVAEAAGVAGLVLTRRHAPPLSPALARASAGAVEWLPLIRVANLQRSLNYLKKKGFWVFGGVASGGVELFSLPERVLGGARVVVLGAEGRGLRGGIEREIDYRVRIPMAGRVASLNVSAAAAVLLFELRRRSAGASA